MHAALMMGIIADPEVEISRFLLNSQEIRLSQTRIYAQSFTAWICLAMKLSNLIIVRQLSMKIVATIASLKTLEAMKKMQSMQ